MKRTRLFASAVSLLLLLCSLLSSCSAGASEVVNIIQHALSLEYANVEGRWSLDASQNYVESHGDFLPYNMNFRYTGKIKKNLAAYNLTLYLENANDGEQLIAYITGNSSEMKILGNSNFAPILSLMVHEEYISQAVADKIEECFAQKTYVAVKTSDILGLILGDSELETDIAEFYRMHSTLDYSSLLSAVAGVIALDEYEAKWFDYIAYGKGESQYRYDLTSSHDIYGTFWDSIVTYAESIAEVYTSFVENNKDYFEGIYAKEYRLLLDVEDITTSLPSQKDYTANRFEDLLCESRASVHKIRKFAEDKATSARYASQDLPYDENNSVGDVYFSNRYDGTQITFSESKKDHSGYLYHVQKTGISLSECKNFVIPKVKSVSLADVVKEVVCEYYLTNRIESLALDFDNLLVECRTSSGQMSSYDFWNYGSDHYLSEFIKPTDYADKFIIPVRQIFDCMAVEVSWDDVKKVAYVTGEDGTITTIAGVLADGRYMTSVNALKDAGYIFANSFGDNHYYLIQ